MQTRIAFLEVDFQKGIPTMKTILTGAILAGLFTFAGCTKTAEQPVATGPNAAENQAATGHNGGDMGPGHMSGGQEHGPVHQGGLEER